MADAGNSKSFWTTLPGILTGIAGVIIAISGLIGGLYAGGILGNSTPTITYELEVIVDPSGGCGFPG